MAFLTIVVLFRRGAKSLERLLTSLNGVKDMTLLLVDTGPDDQDEDHCNTRLVAEGWLVNDRVIDYRPPVEVEAQGKRYIADFAHARNFAHAQVQTPWSMFLDSDDELWGAGELNSLIDWLKEGADGQDAISLRYVYDDQVQLNTVRLFNESRPWVWRGHLHEEREFVDGTSPEVFHYGPSPWVNHQGDRDASVARNEKILATILPQDMTLNERLSAASLYALRGERKIAIPHAEFVWRQLPASGAGRRAALVLATILSEELRFEEAILTLGGALEANPDSFEIRLELARIYAKAKAWGRAVDHYRVLLNMEPHDTSSYPADMEAMREEAVTALLAVGDWRGARRASRGAFDPRIDLAEYRDTRAHATWLRHRLYPEERAAARDAPVEAIGILAPGPVPFDSTAHLRAPLGGSEQAIVHLAQQLAAQSRQEVVVWTNLPEDAPTAGYDSLAVHWRPLEDFDPSVLQKRLLVWRDASKLRPLAAAGHRTFFWAHDVPSASLAREYLHAHKIIVLSEYHKRLFEDLFRFGPEREEMASKLVVLGNGVIDELPDFDALQRKSHQVVYASSAVRGLGILLAIWGHVRWRVPDAELKILYPLDLLESPRATPEQREFSLTVRGAARSLPGVELVGGVSHPELLRYLGESSIWAYPCIFPEISCILAMEAQAMGCVPVATDFAALEETIFEKTYCSKPLMVKRSSHEEISGSLLHIPSGDDPALMNYRSFLINALLDQVPKGLRQKMAAQARTHFSWRSMAQRFLEVLA